MFTLYTAYVIRIAYSIGVDVHCCADDLKLYVHCRANEAAATVACLIACIAASETWMSSNRLKMNPEKTQFIWLGSRNQLAVIHIAPLYLHDETIIALLTNVRNLGAIFDSKMTVSDHINGVTRTCFYQLRQLSFVQCSMSADSARMLVHAFVSSRIDCCNLLLYSAGAHITRSRKLQVVLNAAARLITGMDHYDHITPVLRNRRIGYL